MNVNHIQKHVLSEKILNYFGTDLSGITIGIWGLAFKPNTDDIREAPALYIIQELLDAGAKIVAYDPEASANVQQYFSKLEENQKSRLVFAQNSWEAIVNADVLAILTEWAEFRGADLKEIKAKLKQPIIFDGRNIYDLEAVEEVGFYYNSIGRKTINKI